MPDEVTIGFVASMSGENAQAGQYKKDAWAVIEKQLEETDGCITIMGKQVKLNVEFVDTDSKADVRPMHIQCALMTWVQWRSSDQMRALWHWPELRWLRRRACRIYPHLPQMKR